MSADGMVLGRAPRCVRLMTEVLWVVGSKMPAMLDTSTRRVVSSLIDPPPQLDHAHHNLHARPLRIAAARIARGTRRAHPPNRRRRTNTYQQLELLRRAPFVGCGSRVEGLRFALPAGLHRASVQAVQDGERAALRGPAPRSEIGESARGVNNMRRMGQLPRSSRCNALG